MDLLEFKVWKAVALVALAFLAGLFGFLPTDSKGDRRDKPPE